MHKTIGVLVAAAAGMLLLAGPAHADTNAYNSGLLTTAGVAVLPVQGCMSPITVLTAGLPLGPPSQDRCAQ
ncbi:hypothetical protein [Longispora albida]|uniref:hypothetical protein n=1 Tax=Longispora albida TaxID=203523 RepID=UPI000375A807|nr:hypothetical protein [Longispora albida]